MDRRQVLIVIPQLLIIAGCNLGENVPASPSPVTSPVIRPPAPLPSGQAQRDMWLADAISSSNPMLSPNWRDRYGSEFVTGFNGTPYDSLVFLVDGKPYFDLGVTTKRLTRGQTWSSVAL